MIDSNKFTVLNDKNMLETVRGQQCARNSGTKSEKVRSSPMKYLYIVMIPRVAYHVIIQHPERQMHVL